METRQDIVNTLASNLRYLRINTQVEEPMTGKIRFMSQRHLAEFLGISCVQQISKFELGTNQMSATQLYKICKVFEISVDSMFDDLTKSNYKKTIKYDIYA